MKSSLPMVAIDVLLFMAAGVDYFSIWRSSDAANQPVSIRRATWDQDSERKFVLTMRSLAADGSAIASGSYYRLSPRVCTEPEKLNPEYHLERHVDRIYVTGLPPDLVNGQRWTGWLAPEGTREVRGDDGGKDLLRQYHVT